MMPVNLPLRPTKRPGRTLALSTQPTRNRFSTRTFESVPVRPGRQQARRLRTSLFAMTAFVMLLVVVPPVAIAEHIQRESGQVDTRLPDNAKNDPQPETKKNDLVTRLLGTLKSVTSHLWHDFGWVLIPFFVVLGIKRLLLRQSIREITACVLDVTALLLDHAIQLVRFSVVELRRLAEELREMSNQEDGKDEPAG